jgi:DeoR/GlpR family transcriptional regulator of sugar metabolism
MANQHKRQAQILELLKNQRNIKISDLSEYLGASQATIRRDFDELAQSGLIVRIHGSAVLAKLNPPEPPVIQRVQDNLLEKQRIGRTAAQLIQEGESIFIGSGTTTMEVARNLCGRSNLTVITNAETVTSILAKEEGITLVSTGGLFRHSEQSFLGHITVQSLQDLRPQKVIMGIRCISVKYGLTSDYLPEVDTDRAIFRSGSELILVADHTKFEEVSPAFVAPIEVINTLVTDDLTPIETITELRDIGIKVIVC